MATRKTPKPEKKGTVLVVREYRKEDRSKIGKNYLKYLRMAIKDIITNSEMNRRDLELLLFVYDLEFFSAKYVAEQLGYKNSNDFRKDYIEPLQKKGLVIPYIHHGNISDEDRQRFNISMKEKYRTRFAITQKARLIIQRFYNKLEGKLPIFISDEREP